MKGMRASAIVRKTVGNPVIWMLYSYMSEYKRCPSDIDDLADGLACMRAKSAIERMSRGG